MKAHHPEERCLPARATSPDRRDPAEDLHAARQRNHHARRGVEAVADPRQAGREHVMDPQPESEQADRDHRQHHQRIAEHFAARERLGDLADETDRRDKDDVDFGMAEEPEQMLPEQRVAAFDRIVELRADQPVGDQEGRCQHYRRHREQDHEARDQDRPGIEWHAIERHARGALLENGADQFDRTGDRRDFGEGNQLRPNVGALARRIFGPGERHIGEPAGLGADVHQEGDPEENAAEQVNPVAEGIEPRERDVARAHHQRNQVDRHCLHHRHGEEEHHRRAVHREDLVVAIRADQPALGAASWIRISSASTPPSSRNTKAVAM
jgi:hypothetical protein